ncbi:MAG: hypothetical protein ABI747_03960 [Candidatus Moraniibacteriota bacterium]
MRFLNLLTLAGGVLVLSGCSLLPQTAPPPTTDQPPTVFQTKPLPGSLWRSSDGGKTFEPKVTVAETTSKITSADVLSLSFLPQVSSAEGLTETVAPVFVGTIASGIFRSENGGGEWRHLDFPPKKIYSFTADKHDPHRMFATGVVAERGKIYRSKDDGTTWEEVYTEPGVNTVIVSLAEHPVDTNVLFAGTSAGTVVKSTDGGNTWKNVGQQVDGPVTDISFDAKKPFVTYLLVFNTKMYYSENGGENWIDWEKVKLEERQKRLANVGKNGSSDDSTALQKQLEAEDKRKSPQNMVSLTPDPLISGTLYAGTNTGLFRSTDFGKFWDEVNIIESAKKFPLRAIAVNPKNSEEVVFTAGRAFYKSANRGVTWSVLELAVDRDVSVIAYDPVNPSILYLGLRKY